MTEQFETWFADHFKMFKMLNGDKNIALAAWTASRAALVVDLPKSDNHDSTWQYKDAAESMLRAAGITVKGDS